jgi:hypothetical protein
MKDAAGNARSRTDAAFSVYQTIAAAATGADAVNRQEEWIATHGRRRSNDRLPRRPGDPWQRPSVASS